MYQYQEGRRSRDVGLLKQLFFFATELRYANLRRGDLPSRIEHFSTRRALHALPINPLNLIGRDPMSALGADLIEARAYSVQVDLLAGRHGVNVPHAVGECKAKL